jgi:hypothetical protein
MRRMNWVASLTPQAIAAAVALAVSVQGQELCVAQDPSRTASRGYLSGGFGAQVPWFHRSVFEIGYKKAPSDRAYTFALNSRFGRYSAFDLVGRRRFEADGFSPGARPLYASVLFGMRGPVPLAQSVRELYARASAGLTFYLGQSGSRAGDPSDPPPVPEVPMRVAPGAELAIGIGRHGAGITPWSEIRLGMEYVSRSGLGFMGPIIAVGLDIPAP